jgi:hypothetical protein
MMADKQIFNSREVKDAEKFVVFKVNYHKVFFPLTCKT